MRWSVTFDSEFDAEFELLDDVVKDEILSRGKLLEDYGPALGRPYVDTLAGSRYPNLKELRFDAADGVWRVAFAFDPQRRAVLLVAGDKSGVTKSRFYKPFIDKADRRYGAHLKSLAAAEKER